MQNKNEIKRLMMLLLKAGEMMLKSGAETYRVEDTMQRMALSRGIRRFDSFVTPTGIFLSAEHKGELYSYIRRVKSISIDLQKVSDVNNFSREFVSSQMSLYEGFKSLHIINKGKHFSEIAKYLACGLTSATFTMMFEGDFLDCIPSFVAGFFLLLFLKIFKNRETTLLVNNILGGMFITIIAMFFVKLNSNFHLGPIISGSIMPLAPGVAITNAIRDFIYGDYLSGVSRAVEATIIAIGIAFGAGIILNFGNLLFGGILCIL